MVKISEEIYPPKEDSFLLRDAILLENLCDKRCLDLGSGSGIQAKAMFESGSNNVISSDINPKVIDSLKMQKLEKLGVCFSKCERPNFYSYPERKWKKIVSDLFSNLVDEKFDFIVFNPPYVPTDEIKWVDLDGGKDGSETIKKFIEQFPKHLESGGIVLLLVSSLNKPEELIDLLKSKSFETKIVSEKKLFFEVLYVIRITQAQT
jgi:release factor glutamine methyltransferase